MINPNLNPCCNLLSYFFYFTTNNDSGEPRLSEMTTVLVVQILPTDCKIKMPDKPKTP